MYKIFWTIFKLISPYEYLHFYYLTLQYESGKRQQRDVLNILLVNLNLVKKIKIGYFIG